MNLPQKTYLTKQCQLFESDFEMNGQVKPLRIMQFLQDLAVDHAEILGVGWNVFDQNGILWVLSKVKIVFNKPVTRENSNFTLYTWPIAPNKFFAERCFVAVDEKGEQLFSATSLWMIISREQRKIVSAETMNDFFGGEYDQIHSDASSVFTRIRKDDSFEFCYEKKIRRSDLDKNGHVNNTNYVTYALDVLPPQAKICSLEVVYNKELKYGDNVQIFYKMNGNDVFVVGEHGETNFTATFKLAN